MLVGRSIHDVEGAIAAESGGADFVVAGHVFDTPSKPGQPGRGIDWLGRVAAAVRIPVIGIGGIDATNLADVLTVGAHGVAVSSAILSAPSPREAARRLYEILPEHSTRS